MKIPDIARFCCVYVRLRKTIFASGIVVLRQRISRCSTPLATHENPNLFKFRAQAPRLTEGRQSQFSPSKSSPSHQRREPPFRFVA